VKTWAMRGTLHLLRAEDLGLWVGAPSRSTSGSSRATSWL
jgi:hypothetical protein